MADITNLENFLTDVAGAIKQKTGKEEKIPAANFDTEILNIETGIDTSSDNPITPEDVVEGKEGFVNGEKITGTVQERTPSTVSALRVDSIKDLSQYNIVRANTSSYNTPVLFRANTPIEVEMNSTDLANAISLTPEKIVKGETIIGVEGIAEGGGALSPEEYEDCLTIAKTILGDGSSKAYTPLNYIESTGEQYIKAELYVDTSKELQIDFQYTSNDTGADDCVIADEDDKEPFIMFGRYRGQFRLVLNDGSAHYGSNTDTERHTLYFGKEFKIDDSKYMDCNSIPNEAISLFGHGNGTKLPSGLRIYSVKQYDRTHQYVRNLIPAKDIATDQIGMYDTVTKIFYYNEGFGEFISGGVK